MKKQLFGLLMVTTLLAPTMTFAAEESMEGKQENTDAVVKAKLTENGGCNENPINANTTACKLEGETDLEKSWGYGYVPTPLAINGEDDKKSPLEDEGPQEISVKGYENPRADKSFIGVKNKSRQTGSWRLTAKTDFDKKLGEKADGITFESRKSLVTDRYKDDSSAGGDLISDSELMTTQNLSILTDKDNGGKVTINKDEAEIFTGKEGIVHNGFYNFQLRECVITIPDTRRIQNDDFNCNITWNLASAPSANEVSE